MQSNNQRLKTNGGFTLVEMLVALLVLSVGLMGIAELHGQSLRAERTALFRSVAINLSSDMADRIRSNRIAEAAYAGMGADNDCDPQTGGPVDCTPAEMAAHDLFVWDQEVASSLPNGQWTVDYDNGTDPPTYTITVSWDEVGEPDPISHVTTLQMPVF